MGVKRSEPSHSGLFIQGCGFKNTNFRWEQSSLVRVRRPVCSCAGLCCYFHGISSHDTGIFIPIYTLCFSCVHPCVFYPELPRRQGHTGVLFILGDPHCLRPPGKCSPAVCDHNNPHIHLWCSAKFVIPDSESAKCRPSENTCANLRTSSTGLLLKILRRLSFTCGKFK